MAHHSGAEFIWTALLFSPQLLSPHHSPDLRTLGAKAHPACRTPEQVERLQLLCLGVVSFGYCAWRKWKVLIFYLVFFCFVFLPRPSQVHCSRSCLSCCPQGNKRIGLFRSQKHDSRTGCSNMPVVKQAGFVILGRRSAQVLPLWNSISFPLSSKS